jgi:hypothetical protein
MNENIAFFPTTKIQSMSALTELSVLVTELRKTLPAPNEVNALLPGLQNLTKFFVNTEAEEAMQNLSEAAQGLISVIATVQPALADFAATTAAALIRVGAIPDLPIDTDRETTSAAGSNALAEMFGPDTIESLEAQRTLLLELLESCVTPSLGERYREVLTLVESRLERLRPAGDRPEGQ